MKTDFEKYAVKHVGINSLALHDYKNEMRKIMLPGSHVMTPAIPEERKMNVALIDVFSRLMIDRIIWILGEIEEVGAAIVQAQLMYLDSVDNKKSVTVHIDSQGGSVISGLSIVSVMEYVSCDIQTINTGMCASMAAVLLGAGTKGRRSSLRFSRTMLHQSSGGVGGTILDARIAMKEWEKYNSILFELLGNYCNKKPEQVLKDAERDKWLNADEAVGYGIIDSVIKPSKK